MASSPSGRSDYFSTGAPDEQGVTGSRISVLGVDPERRFSGGETQVLALTLALRDSGCRAELACDPDGILAGRAAAAGIRCHPLRIRNSIDFAAGIRLRRLLARERYNVVHFHTARAHALAPFADARKCIRVVTRRMDNPPNRIFAPWLYGRAVDGVAAISPEVAAVLERAGVSRERIRIIRSGVDCVRFAPPAESERTEARRNLGLAREQIAIGNVAALEPRKGHRYLLEAIAKLVRSGDAEARRNIRICCFIAGQGSLRVRLREDAERLGIGSLVRIMGQLDDVRELLRALDIFVLPSLSEGLGVAALEAMACGLPVVATDTGGLAGLIEDARTGYKFPPADIEALAQQLARLIGDLNLAGRLGANARAEVVENYSIGEMARSTLDFYRACIGGRQLADWRI
jgi:glycosyltransferase involved in cell wall biosynthesis